MNYYPFHIGDYRSSTMHLSNDEDLAYRRLIDWYYDTEKPIPDETQWVSRRLRVGTEALETVLRDFFVLTDAGWVNDRCEREIAEYRKLQERNKANGAKGGRPRKGENTEKTPKINPAETQKNPVGSQSQPTGKATNNQEPITNNQEPSNKSSSEQSPDAPKPSRKKFGTPEDREAAEWMFERIKSILPSAKPPSMDAWANDVRLMREQDGRTHREICELFGWANRDSFWSANILSPAKLREKWTQLCAQRNRPVQSVAQPINKQQAQEDRNRAALANWRPPELRGDSYERG